jgi:hypothetical protein
VVHHALEMFLKAALISEGYTIFNPKKLSQLDPSETLDEDHCAWNHNLVDLARMLSAKSSKFDLSAELDRAVLRLRARRDAYRRTCTCDV